MYLYDSPALTNERLGQPTSASCVPAKKRLDLIKLYLDIGNENWARKDYNGAPIQKLKDQVDGMIRELDSYITKGCCETHLAALKQEVRNLPWRSMNPQVATMGRNLVKAIEQAQQRSRTMCSGTIKKAGMYIYGRAGLGDEPARAPKPARPGLWSSPPYLRFDNLDRFDFNKSSLTDRLRSMVNNLATAVSLSWKTTQPITTVRLVGHTDSTGEEKYNRGLGDRRAQTVKDELLSKLKGLTGRVLIVVEPSPGESKPIADNRTSDGRERNRRVEVFITTGAIPPPSPPPPPPPKPPIDVTKAGEEAARKIEEEAERRRQQQRYNRPIPPPPPRGKSLSQWLDEALAPLPGWLARRIRNAVISGSCYGLEVLLTQAGGRLGDQQKEQLRKQCEEAAKKPIR